jgi:hypothetical protein
MEEEVKQRERKIRCSGETGLQESIEINDLLICSLEAKLSLLRKYDD